MGDINVGILVVADSIPEEIKNRFRNCIEWSKPKSNYEIVMMEHERDEEEPFNKCILLNAGLKMCFEKKFDVIIQTDIDLVVSPGAIDFTAEVAMNDKCCCHIGMIRLEKGVYDPMLKYTDYPWNEWVKNGKKQYASGCWNGMIPKMWELSGGWNPAMTNWGQEDGSHRRRAIRNGVKWKDRWEWIRSYPLIHPYHDKRSPNNSRNNKELDDKTVKSYL